MAAPLAYFAYEAEELKKALIFIERINKRGEILLTEESKFIAKFLIGFGFIMLLLSVLCVIFSLFSSEIMIAIVSLFGLLNSAIAIGVGEIVKKLNNVD